MIEFTAVIVRLYGLLDCCVAHVLLLGRTASRWPCSLVVCSILVAHLSAQTGESKSEGGYLP